MIRILIRSWEQIDTDRSVIRGKDERIDVLEKFLPEVSVIVLSWGGSQAALTYKMAFPIYHLKRDMATVRKKSDG